MRVIFGALKEFNDDAMLMAKQFGADGIHFNTPPIPGDKTWDRVGLHWLKDYCARFGLKLEAIENVPIRFYDKVLLGQDGRDEQIENYINIIRCMGEEQIPVLGHHFCPNWAWRTTLSAKGRGGANVSAYHQADEKTTGNAYVYPYITDGKFPTHDELWANYFYFMDAVLPVAEQCGIKLTIHPSDPPLPFVDGKARIFTCPEDFDKADAHLHSPAWAINLCLGCFSQYGGENAVLSLIKKWGERKKIVSVHFRDVCGGGTDFQECFLGEGNFDPARVLEALYDVNYDGFIIDDHVPYTVNHTRWGHTARAHETGYIQGMLKMLIYQKTKQAVK